MQTCFKSIAFWAALTLVISLQGCLFETSAGAYAFQHRGSSIAGGAEQSVFQGSFPAAACPGNGFFLTIGQIAQAAPLPSVVNLLVRRLDADGTILQEKVFAIQVDPDGTIQQQIFPYAIDGGCFNAGEQLSVAARPEGGVIAQGALVTFEWAQVATK